MGHPKKIVILTGSHLSSNPRVVKEATALAEAGYHVDVLGGWLDKRLKEEDGELRQSAPFRFVPVFDNDVVGQGLAIRARLKTGIHAHRLLGYENRWQLGYSYSPLRKAARTCSADLYIAHSESAMAVAVDLMRNGCRVGVDMEDWFSEDLLPEARKQRPLRLLHSLEKELLTRGAYASCTSRAMSGALSEFYGCQAPTAIYNVFPWASRQDIDGLSKDRVDRSTPSVHWFSQTVGPGRGLEELFAALPLLCDTVSVHIRGRPVEEFVAKLMASIPERCRPFVHFHDLVSNRELLSRISEHDIGFSGEQPNCLSRDLTITNKMFLYQLAGLAVVASDTTGQQEVASVAPGSVSLYRAGDVAALAHQLDRLLASPDLLAKAKQDSLKAAKQRFCWEREVPGLLASVSSAIEGSRVLTSGERGGRASA